MRNRNSSKRRPISREEVEAMLDFYYGASRPHTIYNETLPRTTRRPKVTITQTVIEFE